MSRDVQFCLAIAADIRSLLADERFESEWSRHPRPGLEDALTALLLEERETVERVVQADDHRRRALLSTMTTDQAFLLAAGAVRYCLQAAAILEGHNAWLSERPNAPGLILNAHRAHDHLYEDRRSLWPMLAGPALDWQE